MVLNDLVDSFCYSQKNAGLKGLRLSVCVTAYLFLSLAVCRRWLYWSAYSNASNQSRRFGRLAEHTRLSVAGNIQLTTVNDQQIDHSACKVPVGPVQSQTICSRLAGRSATSLAD